MTSGKGVSCGALICCLSVLEEQACCSSSHHLSCGENLSFVRPVQQQCWMQSPPSQSAKLCVSWMSLPSVLSAMCKLVTS